nr:glycosyltransferase [Faecalicoccus pleomorphus]
MTLLYLVKEDIYFFIFYLCHLSNVNRIEEKGEYAVIPKIIHYCWFGEKEIPNEYKNYIKTWKKYCPDYQIKEWNEKNFNIDQPDYIKEAYEQKKWAFVSDFARLKIVYEEGGIYLDTDVELVKSLDDLLKLKCFLASEKTGYVNTGLGFGAEKKNHIIYSLLEEYTNRHFIGKNGVYDSEACPKKNTRPLRKYGYKFSPDRIVTIRDATIFPPVYFDSMNFATGEIHITENTYSIHHYASSWVSDEDYVQNKKINEIIKNNNFILGHLKKQWFLYKNQKEKGKAKGFVNYLISKIRLKINL